LSRRISSATRGLFGDEFEDVVIERGLLRFASTTGSTLQTAQVIPP